MAEVSNSIIITSNYNKLISLKATYGHYATSSSHINYFIDMTHLKCKRREAKAVAEYISQAYKTSTLIDTIVCMDGTEIIGAYLADELCSPGMQSVNSQNFIFIITPEQTTYTYEFEMNDKDDNNGRLEFNLGNKGSTATVYIKNVRVEEITE